MVFPIASPRKKTRILDTSAERELLQRRNSDPGKGVHDRTTNQDLIHHLTRQVGLVVHQVVDLHEVPGQTKHRPVDSHDLLTNLDLLTDDIEAPEAGNSDALEKKRRSEG